MLLGLSLNALSHLLLNMERSCSFHHVVPNPILLWNHVELWLSSLCYDCRACSLWNLRRNRWNCYWFYHQTCFFSHGMCTWAVLLTTLRWEMFDFLSILLVVFFLIHFLLETNLKGKLHNPLLLSKTSLVFFHSSFCHSIFVEGI